MEVGSDNEDDMKSDDNANNFDNIHKVCCRQGCLQRLETEFSIDSNGDDLNNGSYRKYINDKINEYNCRIEDVEQSAKVIANHYKNKVRKKRTKQVGNIFTLV